MKLKYIAGVIAITFVAFACKKYTVEDKGIANNTDNLGNVVVADDFTWVTSKSFEPTITFEGELADQFLVLEVLDNNFNRIHKYFKASTESKIAIDKQISAVSDTAYLFCSKANIFFPFNTDNQDITVRVGANSNQIRKQNFTSKYRLATKNDCASGCDRVVNGGSGNINVGKKETVCITSDFQGGITINDEGTVNICANVTLSYINIGSKSVNINISSGGRLVASNLNIYDKVTLTNSGRVELSSNLNLDGKVVNFGTWINAGGLNLNNGGEIENLNGATMTFGGNANVNNDITNAGEIIISGNLNLNNGAKVENYCAITISGNANINDEIYNGSYLKVTGTSTANNGSKIEFADKAIWHTANLTLNGGYLYGGEKNAPGIGVFVVNNNTVINSGPQIKEGFIDICDANGIETNNLSENEKLSLKYCETTVNTDDCIKQGIDSAQDPDGDDDDDGVDNGDDDDDSDSDVAGTFSYPSSGYAYRAFEDLWPSRGDYDVNDLVLKYKITFKTDKKNNLQKAVIQCDINAIGAGHINGIGLQFLQKSGESYTRYGGSIYKSIGEGAEIDERDPSVVILAEDIRQKIGPIKYKNNGEGPDGEPYSFEFEIEFEKSAKIDGNSVIPDLFLFRTENRGLEVHLPGLPPTEAAADSLFTTKEDRSSIDNWYKTVENYPWGMEIHGVEGFLHPRSRISIIAAYPQFNTWVSSNGQEAKNWYEAPVIELCY